MGKGLLPSPGRELDHKNFSPRIRWRNYVAPRARADVPSSDQHTVKPWFAGNLNFSPPVEDLAKQGFPLIGGRLDYVDNRPVAALIYQRQKHFINLFIWPSESDSDAGTRTVSRQGYNLFHWTRSGMTFWAASDLNNAELQEFIELVQNQTSPTVVQP
jgi:anti-sigma factor RsiW